jgi:MFS family permease
MLFLAFVPSIATAAVFLLGAGFCFSMWAATSQSILQLSCPDALRGRVASLFNFFFAGLSPIGSLLAGWFSDVGGTRLAFLVAGTSGMAASAYFVLHARTLPTADVRPLPTEYVDEVI